ncbi:MAG TPA: trp RNA-binding attenuation protein MtrB [Firmicutes bacterium]|nr:trp RNA-binding attenuation protein MtrB [Bacillota bacterium]
MSVLVVVKALEDGVSVLFTSGDGNECPQPERLDRGEVMVLSAPDKHDRLHVRGHAEIYTPEHKVISESGLVIGGRSEEH